MRNDAWDEFVGIRNDQRLVFYHLFATYLSGDDSDLMVGRMAGALHQLVALPYTRGAVNEIDYAIDPAHRINKNKRAPCGCARRKRCVLPTVSPEVLLERLARTDPALGIPASAYSDEDGWGFEPFV